MKNENAFRWVWLPVAAALAAVCAALRRWQLTGAFEGELKLPIPMAPASVALVCAALVCAVLFALLARGQPVACLPQGPGERRRWRCPLTAPGDSLGLTVMVAAAFLSLVAVPILFRDGTALWATFRARSAMGVETGGNNGILLILTAITALVSFFGLLLSARANYRGEEKSRALIVLPALNGCFWLMESYRGHAADPVLWDYVPMLLAIVCGMCFYLDCGGLSAGSPHPRRTLWLAGMTAVLSAVALAGGWELSGVLLLASQLAAALCVLWRLPGNLTELACLAPEPEAEEPSPMEGGDAAERSEDTTHE